MAGEALLRRPSRGANRMVVIRQVGELLARLHAVPIASFLDGRDAVPLDRDGADLSGRLASRFGDVAEVLEEHPRRWTFPVPFEAVVATALARLPSTFAPVLVHSNPGPAHVFHDGVGTFTGLIDFGDSYLSHPAMDLRSWPDPADRIALRDAYLGGRPPSNGFDAVWTATMMAADASALVTRPELATAAAADLAVRLCPE
jgi:hygromycin-B 7''-O-kinase